MTTYCTSCWREAPNGGRCDTCTKGACLGAPSKLKAWDGSHPPPAPEERKDTMTVTAEEIETAFSSEQPIPVAELERGVGPLYWYGLGYRRAAGVYSAGPGEVSPVAAEALQPNDIGVIRAAEGVVLEPGEYEVVEIAHWEDHAPERARVGSVVRCLGKYQCTLSADGWRWLLGSTLVTAVRRVEPGQNERPPYVPKLGERVRVVEVHEAEKLNSPRIGEWVLVSGATKGQGRFVGWIALQPKGSSEAFWCRVEPVSAPAPKAQTSPVLMSFGSDALSPEMHAQMDAIIESLGPDLAKLMPDHLPAHWEKLASERDSALSRIAELEARQLNADAGMNMLRKQHEELEAENARLTTQIEGEKHHRAILASDLNALIDGKRVTTHLASVVRRKHAEELKAAKLAPDAPSSPVDGGS